MLSVISVIEAFARFPTPTPLSPVPIFHTQMYREIAAWVNRGILRRHLTSSRSSRPATPHFQSTHRRTSGPCILQRRIILPNFPGSSIFLWISQWLRTEAFITHLILLWRFRQRTQWVECLCSDSCTDGMTVTARVTCREEDATVPGGESDQVLKSSGTQLLHTEVARVGAFLSSSWEGFYPLSS